MPETKKQKKHFSGGAPDPLPSCLTHLWYQTSHHTLKSPINAFRHGNTIISDATISYDARTGAEYAQHTTPLTRSTRDTPCCRPNQCPPPYMILNGKVPSRLMRPEGRELGGKRTKIFNASLNSALSLGLVSRLHATRHPTVT